MTELGNYKGFPKIDSPCRIDVDFRFEAKDACSPKIGDVDNLLKAVLDALVELEFLEDDRIVKETHTKKDTAQHDGITITAYLLG